jgi:hypothetical protein
MKFPVRLNERYPCQGIDADGVSIVFHDLLSVGDRVGQPVKGDPLNAFPPHGRVVERDGGLFIDAEVPDAS